MTQAAPLFDRSFDVPSDHEPEVKYTDEDLAAAHQTGIIEGQAVGLEQAKASAESHLTELVRNIADRLSVLTDQDGESRQLISLECAKVLQKVCEKAIPSLAEHVAVGEIVEIVRQCLSMQSDEPRIVVRVANEIADAVQTQLGTASVQTGFTGQLVLIPDETLDAKDCAVLWADGGAERRFDEIWSQIEQALTRVLDRRSDSPVPQPASP